ncbi:hypothetical protein [Salinigranum rubrum]|nr:hypothetical protein [Salinigranum rubrum]
MTSSDTPLMKEVSHTPPEGDSVTNVWQRGRAKTETGETSAPADD